MSGSGLSEKQYDRNKRAHDNLQRDLIKSGVKPEKAREIARDTAHKTDKQNQGK